MHKTLKKGRPVASQGTLQMKEVGLALVLLAVAGSASASSSSDFSLLECGVMLGSRTLGYSNDTQPKKFTDSRMNHVLGAVRTPRASDFSTTLTAAATRAAAQQATVNKTEKRLPPKFTLATFGCSWR
jgi:hypothetical protein